MTKNVPENLTGENVAKRILWLAWQACGSPTGMGWLQNNPDATEEKVWENVAGCGDYPGGNMFGENNPGDFRADYVFGRMMKLSVKWTPTTINLSDSTPRPDYQAWCGKYKTYEKLFDAAVESLSRS